MISRVILPVLLAGSLSSVSLLTSANIGVAQALSQPAQPTSISAVPANQVTSVEIDTANPAVPNAEEVFIDVQSAFHATRYQSGESNGLRYILFPDGTGRVMQSADARSVAYEFDCSKASYCRVIGGGESREVMPRTDGNKPTAPSAPDAYDLTHFLTEWVLDQTAPAQPQMPVAIIEPVAQVTTKALSGQQPPVVETKDAAVSAYTQTASAPSKEDAQPRAAPRIPIAARAIPEQATVVSSNKTSQLRPIRKKAPVQRAAVFSPAQNLVVHPKPERPAAEPRETIFQRLDLKCAITGSVTLRYRDHNTGAKRFGKPRTSIGCGARLSDKLTLRVSAIGYFDQNEKSPDDAEFTYAFTYRATDKLTLTYSNYSGRISDNSGAFLDSLGSGSLRASYRLPKFELPNKKTIGCIAGIGLAKVKENRASLSCSYVLTKRIRISATAFAYFPGKQDPSDADFSYTGSYRINKDWSLLYSNYGNNRFFWNKSSSQGEGILGGSLSMIYRFEF